MAGSIHRLGSLPKVCTIFKTLKALQGAMYLLNQLVAFSSSTEEFPIIKSKTLPKSSMAMQLNRFQPRRRTFVKKTSFYCLILADLAQISYECVRLKFSVDKVYNQGTHKKPH